MQNAALCRRIDAERKLVPLSVPVPEAAEELLAEDPNQCRTQQIDPKSMQNAHFLEL